MSNQEGDLRKALGEAEYLLDKAVDCEDGIEYSDVLTWREKHKAILAAAPLPDERGMREAIEWSIAYLRREKIANKSCGLSDSPFSTRVLARLESVLAAPSPDPTTKREALSGCPYCEAGRHRECVNAMCDCVCRKSFNWMIEKLGTEDWQKFCYQYSSRLLASRPGPTTEARDAVIEDAKAIHKEHAAIERAFAHRPGMPQGPCLCRTCKLVDRLAALSREAAPGKP